MTDEEKQAILDLLNENSIDIASLEVVDTMTNKGMPIVDNGELKAVNYATLNAAITSANNAANSATSAATSANAAAVVANQAAAAAAAAAASVSPDIIVTQAEYNALTPEEGQKYLIYETL